MQCRPDTHQHSYLMKTDIGIHPAFPFKIKKNNKKTEKKKKETWLSRKIYVI